MKQVTAYQTEDGLLHATDAEAAKHETWAVFLQCARDGGLEPRSVATLHYTFNLLYDCFEFVRRQHPAKMKDPHDNKTQELPLPVPAPITDSTQ